MEKSDFSSNQWQRILNEIREKLIYQAKLLKPISYGDLCRQLNYCSMEPNDNALHTALGEISEAEYKAGRGFLSVFCGSSGDRHTMPGDGFFKMVIDLGGNYKNKIDFVKDEREKIHNIHRDPGVLKM
jgi:hypothetical protein